MPKKKSKKRIPDQMATIDKVVNQDGAIEVSITLRGDESNSLPRLDLYEAMFDSLVDSVTFVVTSVNRSFDLDSNLEGVAFTMVSVGTL